MDNIHLKDKQTNSFHYFNTFLIQKYSQVFLLMSKYYASLDIPHH